MFCPECGKSLEEGKSFCKYCGANVGAALAGSQPSPQPPQQPPAAPAPPPPAPSTPPPFSPPAAPASPPPFQQAPPPFQQAPPPFQQAPPQFQQAPPSPPPPFAAAQQPQFQPQFQPPVQPKAPRGPSGGEPRPRWVMPFLLTMAGLVVLSLIGLVVVMVTAGGGSPKRDDPDVSITTITLTTEDTTGTSIPNTDDGSSTTATVPGYDPGSTNTTGGGQQSGAGYVAALDGLEAVLAYADGQMPGLADQINNTAPGVPAGVNRELQQLHEDVSAALDELALIDPPEQYRAADDLIFEASNEMLYRIEQTIEGIDAMWAQNKVAAGNPYFDAGREARDAFRTLFKEYEAARP